MREQFENAYRALYPTSCQLEPDKFSRDALGEYEQTIVQVAWKLYQNARGAAVQDQVPQEWTNVLAYVLQDDMQNRLTPRVIDIAYNAFLQAKRPNSEDGSASDWFNDTKPMVKELIAKLRKDLVEEFGASPVPQQPDDSDINQVHAGSVFDQQPAQPWPVRGVRVDGDKVVIAVKGGNDAARWLCGEILARHTVPPEQPAKVECFLQDTRSYVGNCPMWWKEGGGYTTRIDEAARFTIEQALAQCRSRGTDLAWLCSDIEPLARPTIDHQYMRGTIRPVPVAEHKKPDDTEGGEA